MPNLPTASLSINEASSGFASGSNLVCILACVSQNADSMPRIFASAQDALTEHNYSPGIDYLAHHIQETDLPCMFVGLPITTVGTVGSQDNSGVTGTSMIYVTAASSGIMEKTEGVVTVQQGTTVGTDNIICDLSLDGNRTTQRVRFGTGTSYTIPYVGIVLNLGTGTLNAGDVFKFQTKAPMWGSTALATAEANLKAQAALTRSWMIPETVPNSTFAGYVTSAVSDYETVGERFTYARTAAPHLYPLAVMSKVQKTATPASVTFASSGHTITRASGSFITDGFAIGDVIAVAGSTSNNGTIGALTNLSATVMTFGSGVVNEGPDATGVVITGSEGLTFASSGETITRAGDVAPSVAGSWLKDGFAVGDIVKVSGTTSNNGTLTAITVLTDTVMTFASSITNEGPIASAAVTITKVLSDSAFVAAETTAFASVDSQKRIDISIGGCFSPPSPITGWELRRPASWPVSCREYMHDVQIPTYRKTDGPLQSGPDGSPWSITDANGSNVEHDERTDGGALAGRFTCLRSWANGPRGAFVALSLTRDVEGALLSRTHNLAVANIACGVVQQETENAIGQVLQLNQDGTGTDASLSLIEQRVNKALAKNLLKDNGEGPRASNAVWSASRKDILSTPGATLNGNLALNLNGTLENIATQVNVT